LHALQGFERLGQIPVERLDLILVLSEDHREQTDRERDEEKEGNPEQEVDRLDCGNAKAGEEIDDGADRGNDNAGEIAVIEGVQGRSAGKSL
jgi:hypothetical protein